MPLAVLNLVLGTCVRIVSPRFSPYVISIYFRPSLSALISLHRKILKSLRTGQNTYEAEDSMGYINYYYTEAG